MGREKLNAGTVQWQLWISRFVAAFFIASGRFARKHILGLFTCCEAARKSVVMDGAEYKHLSEQKIMQLDGVGDVLFQALLLDDVRYGGNELYANLHTIYCLNEKG